MDAELIKLNNSFDKLSYLQHYEVPTRLLDWTESFLIALYFATHDIYGNKKEDEGALIYELAPRDLAENLKSDGQGYLHYNEDFGTKIRSEFAFSNQSNWQKDISRKYGFELEKYQFKRNEDKTSASDQGKIDDILWPIPVYPSRTFERVRLQKSVFTLHGGYRDQGKSSEGLDFGIKNIIADFNGINMSGHPIKNIYLILGRKAMSKISQELEILGINMPSLYSNIDKQKYYFPELRPTVKRRLKNRIQNLIGLNSNRLENNL